jgi:hypothetical protein
MSPEDTPPSIGPEPERTLSAYDPEHPATPPDGISMRHVRNPTPLMSHRLENTVPMLIGLGGWKGSGKDTVADAIVAARPNEFVKIGMSDALHEAMLALNPIVYPGSPLTPSLTYSEAVATHGYVRAKALFPEARRLLQALGTDVGRNLLAPDLWVEKMRTRAEERMEYGYSVLVTGIRYPNELEALHALNGITVWVDRPGLNPPSTEAHDSETSVTEQDFDVVISNDSDLEALRAAAVDAVPAIRALHRDAYPKPYALEARAARERREDGDLYVGQIGAVAPDAIVPGVRPVEDDMEPPEVEHWTDTVMPPDEPIVRRRPAPPEPADFYRGPLGTEVTRATLKTLEAPYDPGCTVCGRDNRNGTHDALEATGHLSHPFQPAAPTPAPVTVPYRRTPSADRGPVLDVTAFNDHLNPCPVCGGHRGHVGTLGTIRIRQCTGCGTTYAAPEQDSDPTVAPGPLASEHAPDPDHRAAAGAGRPGDPVAPPEPDLEAPDNPVKPARPATRRVRRGNL